MAPWVKDHVGVLRLFLETELYLKKLNISIMLYLLLKRNEKCSYTEKSTINFSLSFFSLIGLYDLLFIMT